MLALCLEGARRNVTDGIDNIFIVAPDDADIRDMCRRESVNYINERELMGFGKDDIHVPYNRNGWLYQQLIKFKGYCLSPCYLALDADHVLLRPHQFVSGDQRIFYMADEFHQPYFEVINKLFGGTVQKAVKKSFISDKMLFDAPLVAQMLHEIGWHNELNWWESIVKYYADSKSGFSEFETYGSWLMARHKDIVVMRDCGRVKFSRKSDLRTCSFSQLQVLFQDALSVTELKH